MQKIIIGFVSVVIILVIAVVLFFSLMKDESRVAEVVTEGVSKDVMVEKLAEQESPTPIKVPIEIKEVKSGNFIKIDPLHYASGNVQVEKVGGNYKIKFQNNFASASGPDLYVYLSAPQEFKDRALSGLDTAKTISLGVLKKQSGVQEYLVSKADFESHNAAIVIWCKQFSVQFSRADLM